MSKDESFIAPARTKETNSKAGIRYRKLEDIKFENTFDESKVTRLLPKAEKGRKKKKKVEYERVSSPRPPAQSYEYKCTSCGEYEERIGAVQLDQEGTYFCRECLGSGGKKVKRRPVKRD